VTTPAFPDRAAIDETQLQSLRALFAEILPGNRFYTKKLAQAGITDPEQLPRNGFEELFARLPFTRKPELAEDQAANPPFGSNLSYPLEHYTRFSQTSGTSGQPIRWLDTTDSWSWMVDNWVQVLRASGVTAEDRIFFAFSFGPFLGFWTAFEAGVRLGCLSLPGGGMSSPARVKAIVENRATVLCCTPTYAIRLGEVAAEEGIDLREGTLRTIIVAGEPGAGVPATRARIERLWPGARLWDHHGMTEVGPVTYECPARRGVLHILETSYLAEVIDPATSAKLGHGAQGELVLTNLGRFGSPLIRYRTGDIVLSDDRSPQTPCICGRVDLALIGGILGRTDDMVVVRGVNLHPTAVEEVVRRHEQVAEYRVELRSVRAMTEVNIQVEPNPGCPDAAALALEVETALRAAFNLRIPVTAMPEGSLPRFELKAKRWVRVE
jgi:phenylacetate-CoA ligase